VASASVVSLVLLSSIDSIDPEEAELCLELKRFVVVSKELSVGAASVELVVSWAVFEPATGSKPEE